MTRHSGKGSNFEGKSSEDSKKGGNVPPPPVPDFVFSLEVMTADLEFRDLVSRSVWGHPAVIFYLHVVSISFLNS